MCLYKNISPALILISIYKSMSTTGKSITRSEISAEIFGRVKFYECDS